MRFQEELEEDSTLFDIVDAVELSEEESDEADPVAELDFEKEALEEYDALIHEDDAESDIL